MRRLLRQLRSFDYGLDMLLLLPSLLVVTPPQGPLVLALQTKMLASFTNVSALVTLFSSEPTCEAT